MKAGRPPLAGVGAEVQAFTLLPAQLAKIERWRARRGSPSRSAALREMLDSVVEEAGGQEFSVDTPRPEALEDN